MQRSIGEQPFLRYRERNRGHRGRVDAMETLIRNDDDREDLMLDAVSLVRRIEFRCPLQPGAIVAGFNPLGWLFVYRGDDPMYRFDERGRLRRAFVDGLMYRTEGETLSQIQRQRDSTFNPDGSRLQTTLLRRDLTPAELDSFRLQMQQTIKQCLAALRIGEVSRRHPISDTGIQDDIARGLQAVLDSREFLAPAIVRRRQS